MFNISFSGLTVDSILKDFTFKIDQLKAISEVEGKRAVQKYQEADALALAADAHTAEATRALSVAARIEALIG